MTHTERIARVCHAVNRDYCVSLGDTSQPTWDEAPQWQKDSAMNGVRFHLNNPKADASASHTNWWAEKIADGWVHGKVKDPAKKEHPCCVPFSALPKEQQAKDWIFRAIVHAMAEEGR
jgi:hypothetical protein